MYYYYETSVQIFNLHITEPVTVFTNVVLSLSCATYAYAIYKNKNEITSNWIAFFSIYAFGIFFGLIKHGSKELLSTESILHIWLFYQMLSAIAMYYLQCAAANFIKSNYLSKLKIAFAIQCFVSMASIAYYENFNAVIINQVVGFTIVGVLYFMRFKKGYTYAQNMFISIGFSTIAAIVSVNKLGIHTWFNHNDLAHVFLFFSFLFLYKTAKGEILETQKVKA